MIISTQTKTEFRPITITLTEEAEAQVLAALIGSTSADKTVHATGDVMVDLYPLYVALIAQVKPVNHFTIKRQ